MKYLLAVGIVVLTLGMVACGNTPTSPEEENTLTGPEEELVGTWRFEDTDFIRVFSDIFEDYLVAQGESRSQARAIVDSAFVGAENLNERLRFTLRLNANKTWNDDRGGAGTWRVDGNDLVTIDEDGTVERTRYFLDGDDLTIIFTKTWFLEALRQDENFDAEVYTLYNQVLQEDDVFRFFLKRR